MGGRLPQLHYHSRLPVWQRGLRAPLRPRRNLQQRLRAVHSLRVARRGSFHGHRGPHRHRCPTTHRPVQMGHPREVPGQVLHAKDDDRDGINNRGWQQEEKVEVPPPAVASSPRADRTTRLSLASCSTRAAATGLPATGLISVRNASQV